MAKIIYFFLASAGLGAAGFATAAAAGAGAAAGLGAFLWAISIRVTEMKKLHHSVHDYRIYFL